MSEPQTTGGKNGDGPEQQDSPGFTFADKRKIRPDGAKKDEPLIEPADYAKGGIGGLEDDAVGQESDENAQLATERLLDLQRLQAEYANYRKRVDRDRAADRDRTIASVIEALLPVLDDIALARQHGDLESGPFASISEKLENTLTKYGLERYGLPGEPFDPAVHDALMHVEEELADGTEVTTVVGVLQSGYRLGDKVIRPARVSVADPN